MKHLMDAGMEVWFYLYIDASPTWRGVELFAATVDCWDGTKMTRRLLPVITLSADRMDVIGRCTTLLYMIYLMCGYSPDRVQWFLSHTLCILSDMGAERYIYKCIVYLRHIYEYFNPGCIFGRAMLGQLLFPGSCFAVHFINLCMVSRLA